MRTGRCSMLILGDKCLRVQQIRARIADQRRTGASRRAGTSAHHTLLRCNASNTMTVDFEAAALRQRCEAAGQLHLLEDWDKLSSEEQQLLAKEVQELDFPFIAHALKASLAAVHDPVTAEPAQNVVRLQDVTPEQQKQWRELGLKLIGEGKAGVLLLAGGQGTRLGSKLPKGCYDVGLPSHKSLFQIQAERVKKVQQLAAAAVAAAQARPLQWYIMTSPFTHDDTVAHFQKHAFFGLDPAQVHFFQQGFLPCLQEDGRIILETSSKVAKAPDGNGGLYRALQTSGTLADMQARGIEALDVYCVDNILARVADPEFLGCCYSHNTQVGARVLAKAYPEEKVGVFATNQDGRLQVLEYSELDPSKASSVNPATGELFYNWSNICMHYFAVPWLAAAATALGEKGAYHIARKQIPSKDGVKVPGVKLEMFIFDPFDSAEKTTLVEVAREDHFAPVKNAPGEKTDSPDTARAACLAQGARWVAAAGGQVTAGAGVEVSPLQSYAGEGLEQLVNGKVFDQPAGSL